MDPVNGEVLHLPTLQIGFDPTTQAVHLGFDPTQFKTWDYVLAVIEMARLKAEQNRKMAELAALQQHAQEQQQAEAVRRALGRGRSP